MEPVSSPTIVPPYDDINQTPYLSPTPAPTSPYLQPSNRARPDLHIGTKLIPPDDHLSSPQQAEDYSNLIAPQPLPSPNSEHESTENNQDEDTNSTKTEIYHPPDYTTDTRSHLPIIDPITEYFQLPY